MVPGIGQAQILQQLVRGGADRVFTLPSLAFRSVTIFMKAMYLSRSAVVGKQVAVGFDDSLGMDRLALISRLG